MNLSSHLQTSGLLDTIQNMSFGSLREIIHELGSAWYQGHQSGYNRIHENLSAFGFAPSPPMIDAVVHHTLLHYYEKFLPLTGHLDTYADYLAGHVNCTEGVIMLRESLAASRGICIAISHFGAVELLAPCLAAHQLPVNAVLKFSTDTMSAAAHKQAEALAATTRFGQVNLIEIGKPKTVAALQMAAALRRQEAILTVFDEKTPYSKPISLFGTNIWGGAGIDRILSFANTPTDIYAAFMIRTGEEHYRLQLNKIDENETDPIRALYDRLETTVTEYTEQWYFLHEALPFIKESAE